MIRKEILHPSDQGHSDGFLEMICGKRSIARKYKPKTILEIGVRYGYSAYGFLLDNPDAVYVGIDNFSYGTDKTWAKENLLKDFPNAKIFEMDSQALPTFVFEKFEGWNADDFDPSVLYRTVYEKQFELNQFMRKTGYHMFDLIHVDGDHSVNGVKYDLNTATALLADNGHILVDDYDRIPEVKQGVDEWLLQHTKLEGTYIPSFTGDMLIRRKAQPAIKIAEVANSRKLLVFHHGLGDVLLFIPLYKHLKKTGDYVLALHRGLGFTAIVPDAVETPGGNFDYDKYCKENGFAVYQIVEFAMSEGSGKTKTEFCAEKEFGLIDYKVSSISDPFPDKIVGVCFQGTCLPHSTNPDYETAKKIWFEVKEAGFTPLEVMFEHVYYNPVNNKFDFVDNTTRGMIVDLAMLSGMLKACYAFLGVASGVWVSAMSSSGIPHNRVCLLEKGHKLRDYYNQEDFGECCGPVSGPKAIGIGNYASGKVKEWLNSLS